MVQNVQTLLMDSLKDSMRNVIPRAVSSSEGESVSEIRTEEELGVSIHFSDPISVKMVLDAHRDTFSKMGEAIFGMYMEGEMLESCIGEIANIIAGGTTTLLSNQGILTDITPPSLLTGYEAGRHESRTVAHPIHIEDIGQIRVLLTAGA